MLFGWFFVFLVFFLSKINPGCCAAGASSPLPPSSSSSFGGSPPPAASSLPPSASSSSAPSSSSSSPQGGGRRRGEEEEKRKKDHRPLAAAPSPSNTTLQKNTHRQRQGWGGGGGGSAQACAGSPAPLASSSPVANGCRKGSCKDEEGEDKSQESPLHILLCREGGGVVVLMEAAPIAGWEGGGRVSTPSLPPHPLLLSPSSFSRSQLQAAPPSGAGRGAGARRRRKKPAPPPLSAYLPPSRAAEDGCERWRRAGRGLPGSATLGAESEGEKPRALLGRGGDSLFASARVGKEAKRLVVGGERRRRPLSDPSERRRRVKLKITKQKKNYAGGKAGDSPRGGLNGREGEGVPALPGGGWGGTAQAARGPSAGSLLPLPGAQRRPGCGRSWGVCGGAGAEGSGGRKKSGKKRREKRGKREREERERRERGRAGCAGRGGLRLGSSLLSPSLGRAPGSLCAALPLARPVRLGLSLPPSVAHTQTKWRLLFLHSPESSEGSERRRRRPEMSQEKKGGGARSGGGARRGWRTQWNAGGWRAAGRGG